ncbi:MAG: hypothetical protein L6R40_004266 [Gallowayella cf. fulva]|nr:MAG: hypothetical protein L6R40_004266 [Xanthomendoza cf. fulva]
MIDIAPRARHVFLIGEGKTDGGSAAAAEDQARRAGATLVHAHRDLIASIRFVPDAPGLDLETYVFSFTMSPQGLAFWIHRYEGPNDVGRYHMTKFDEVAIHGKANLEKIRRNLHNIIEWGSITRYQQLKILHKHIEQWCRENLGNVFGQEQQAEVEKAENTSRK